MSEFFAALQLVIVSALLLALLVAALLAIGQRPMLAALRREAPAQRVRCARALLLAPALLAALYAVLSLTLPRWLAATPVMQAACYTHDDALLHACLWHPINSGSSLELWIVLALASLVVTVLLLTAAARLLREWRLLGSLFRLATPTPKPAQVHVVEVDQPLALACGLRRGRILISRYLISRLQPRQIEIIVEHEADHVRHHDVFWRLLVRSASLLHWPALRRRLLHEFELATEQRCDLAAAARVGSALDVAETLLAVEGLMRPRAPNHGAALAFGEHFIGERIEALLQPKPRAAPTARVVVAMLLLVTSLSSTAGLHAVAERLITWVGA